MDGPDLRPRRLVILPVVVVVAGVVAAVVGLLLIGSGVVLLRGDDGGDGGAAARTPATPTRSAEPPPYAVEPAVRLRGKPEPTPPPVVAAAPVRLQVPALGLDVPVVGIGAVDGILQPPGDPQVVGWWSSGAEPGADRGSALLTGHTVHTGGGAMDDLETLRRGDRVTVRTVAGRVRYAVSSVEIFSKAALAAASDRVFDQGGPGRLVLITCEDWNGRDYESNVIVFARPV